MATRFSRTLSEPNTRRPSGTRPTPRRATALGAERPSTRPRKVTLPPVAGSMPISVLTVVVLPMPLRPISEMTSPSLASKAMPNSTLLDP